MPSLPSDPSQLSHLPSTQNPKGSRLMAAGWRGNQGGERGRMKDQTNPKLKAHPLPRHNKIFGEDTPRWLTALASASLSPPRDKAKPLGSISATRRVEVDEGHGVAGGDGAYVDMVRRAPGPSMGGLQDAPGVNSARRDGTGSTRAREAIKRNNHKKQQKQAAFLSSDEDDEGYQGPASHGDGPTKEGWHTLFVKKGGMDGLARTPPNTSETVENSCMVNAPHIERLRDNPGEMHRRKTRPIGARAAHSVTFDFFRLQSDEHGMGGAGRPMSSQQAKDSTELWYADSLRRNPNDAGLVREYAIFLHGEGRLVEAEQMYKRALGINSKDASSLCGYGTLMWEMDKKSRAEELLRQALHADPGHFESLASYGALLLNKGEAKASHTRFRLALMSQPSNPSLLLNNALAMEEIPSYAFEEVEDMYQRAVEAETESHEALFAYALFLKNRIGEVDGAERAYIAALKRCPSDPSLLASYAVLLTERLGVGEKEGGLPDDDGALFSRAERAFKQSLALDPTQADNVYSYAVLLSKYAFLHGEASGTDSEEEDGRIEGLFKRALSLRRDDDADTLTAYAIYLHEKELRRRQKPASPEEGARRRSADGFGRAKSGTYVGGKDSSPSTQVPPRLPSGDVVRLPSGEVGRVGSGEGRRDSLHAGGRGRVDEIDRLYRRALKAQPGHDLALQGFVGFLRTFRGVEGEKAALKLEKERFNPKHTNFRRNYEIQPAHNRIALHHMHLPPRQNHHQKIEHLNHPQATQSHQRKNQIKHHGGQAGEYKGRAGQEAGPTNSGTGPGSPWAAQSGSGMEMWGGDDTGPKLSPERD